MKYLLFTCLLFVGLSVYGQDRIRFQYDAAGNQISRAICANCLAKTNTPTTTETFKTAETLTEKDLIQDVEFEQLSYYPNPVLEELYVKWHNTATTAVSQVTLYNVNGQEVKTVNNLQNTTKTTISFNQLPEGYYILVLSYTDGSTKNLKIVKNNN